jgi:hypothetical protein
MQQHLLHAQAQAGSVVLLSSPLDGFSSSSSSSGATRRRATVVQRPTLLSDDGDCDDDGAGGAASSSSSSVAPVDPALARLNSARNAVFRSPALFNTLLSCFSLGQSVPLARVCRAWRAHTIHAARRAAVTQSPLGGTFASAAF